MVLPVLVREAIGESGMKPMGGGLIFHRHTVTPMEGLHDALSLPTASVITGIDSLAILKQALDAARTVQPLTPEHIAALLARTAPAATSGRYEAFKTSDRFDSTAHHPQWLGETPQLT
jgi:hypothetical protein